MKTLKKQPSVTFLPLILPIIITFLIAYATQEYARNKIMLSDIDFFCAQFEKFTDNGYSRAKLNDIRQELLGIKRKKLEKYLEGDSFKELYRAMSKLEFEGYFIDHYILSWKNDLELIYQTNIAALKGGVEIIRLFILTDEIIKNSDNLNTAYQIMERQFNDGIVVKYARQYDLIRSEVRYLSLTLNNIALFDQKILFIFTPANQTYSVPTHTQIYWSKEDLMEKNPFPEIFKSSHIHNFYENSKTQIFSNNFISY